MNQKIIESAAEAAHEADRIYCVMDPLLLKPPDAVIIEGVAERVLDRLAEKSERDGILHFVKLVEAALARGKAA